MGETEKLDGDRVLARYRTYDFYMVLLFEIMQMFYLLNKVNKVVK